MPLVLLTYYCALILVASIIGGMIPVWFQLTHRWMQVAVSFVAGVMLGISVLHMLPHAIAEASAAAANSVPPVDNSAASALFSNMEAVRATMLSLLAGILVMFFIERFFSYHHHDVPERPARREHGAGSKEQKTGLHEPSLPAPRSPLPAHDLSWSGAALGLALHSVLNGVALAAAVQHGSHGSWLAGFGTFLVIVLHKPFDAMTIGMLMARGGWSLPWRHSINTLFSLAIPAGALLFYFGLMSESAGAAAATRQWYVACALAFSAGTFLCISLSDLLPELHFHHHDRIKLSLSLILGLAVAHAAAWLESAAHATHAHPNVVRPIVITSPVPAERQLHDLPSLPDRREPRFHPVHPADSPKRIVDKKHREDPWMAVTHQRTWQQYRVGHFLCTVQLDPLTDRQRTEDQRELGGLARRLIGLMDSHRLPTTWAVSDPTHSAATTLISRSAVEHELAISGDTYWLGPTAGRTRFAREFARRMLQARSAGLRVTTLVPRVAPLERHIDLLVKQRISAICGGLSSEPGQRLLSPRALHYGVWELPVTGSLPVTSNWLSSGGRTTWRRIRRAAHEAATFHLLIDAPAMTHEGRRAEKTVAWLMRRIAELRDRGLVEVQTMRAAASRLASVPAPAPQHSILRAA